MTRYIKQRDQFSCVAVVILNAYKWLGYDVTYARNYMEVRCQAGLTIGRGAGATGFLRAARYLPLTRICKPNFAKIKRALDAGNAVIVRSRWHHGGHIFLVTRMTKRSVFCVNVYGGHVWRSRRIFKHYYLSQETGRLAAWIVRKPCHSNRKPKRPSSRTTSRPSSKSSSPPHRKARNSRSGSSRRPKRNNTAS